MPFALIPKSSIMKYRQHHHHHHHHHHHLETNKAMITIILKNSFCQFEDQDRFVREL